MNEERIYNGERIVFLKNGAGKTGYPYAYIHMQKNKSGSLLTPFIKINSK